MVSKHLIAAALVASNIYESYAACNLNCNGHGTCGAWDICSCYASYSYAGAEDCSLRICPYGQVRGTIGTNVHAYAECSDNGICNRESGECECREGYTGIACKRQACPDDCNGRGQCQLLVTFNSGYTTEWDSDQTMICKCDPGYEGSACEFRSCPRGDDPLTLQATHTNGDQVDEVQTCTLSAAATGTFSLRYDDWRGQSHETRPLTVTDVTDTLIKEALAELPNNIVPSVDVTVTGSASGGDLVFTVTFSNTDTSGGQNLLVANVGAKTTGQHPIMGGLSAGTISCARTTAGTEESKVCAGRGVCDLESGECACHQGFYGHACAFQTALQ